MQKSILSLIASVVVLVGCSTTVPVNYIASPTLKGSGAVSAGKFVYQPAERGEVKANQFQSAAASMGIVYLSENVSDLLQSSLRKELIAAGFDPDADDSLEISGDVSKFLFNWTGFIEMDMYLDVIYRAKKENKVIFEYEVKSHKAMPKAAGYDSEAAKAVIADNLNKALTEMRKRKLL